MPPRPVLVAADEEHLSERLGLFVIVVLGEGLIQIVTAAGGIDWDAEVYVVAGCSFLILVSLWWLSLERGDNGLPMLSRGALPVRLSLLLHWLFSGALVALAIVLGEAVTEADAGLARAPRLLVTGALMLCLLVLAASSLASGRRLAVVFVSVLPGVAVLAAVALPHGDVSSVAVLPLLTAAVVWPVLHAVARERASAQAG